MAQVKLDGVEVPGELLELLDGSRLSTLDRTSQIRVALAIHLFVTGEVSIGRAAELSGESRSDFAALLSDLSIPTVHYDEEQYEQDMAAVDKAECRRSA